MRRWRELEYGDFSCMGAYYATVSVRERPYPIAFVLGDDEHDESVEVSANADLIAAAPDLLEALDWLLGCIEADPKNERHPDDWKERLSMARAGARAAIAKAGGAA